MKHIRRMIPAAMASALAFHALPSAAATVELEWGDPAAFRDIRATSGGQTRFQEQVMTELEEAFLSHAAGLAEGQTLHVAVDDIDLAGEVEYFHRNFPQGLRVVRTVDAPSLLLRYELRDADGTVLKAGEERVQNPGFNYRTLTTLDRHPLRHEKALIDKWYDSRF